MSLGKGLLGLMAGIAAGAFLGVLFARGKDSDAARKKTATKVEDRAKALKVKFKESLDSISEKKIKTQRGNLPRQKSLKKT
ncbi:MAG: YtxH domain-containing protein [Chitinispirillaceae bacterium]|nr:YtxH domain-containing protein [Chitinispirillaceae bacterium]